ncbi:hypothetical protein HYT17_01145 [Candidatus Microgenomates bacterium]|nr:hypothetical protein [Candidatus Microgenomates bacterium]
MGNSKKSGSGQKANLKIPIRYCVFVQDNQEQSLDKLNNLHDKSEKKKNDLKALINSFVEDNRNNSDITNLPYIENFLDSLRQVEYSFSEYKEAEKYLQSKTDSGESRFGYFMEKKTSAVLNFFFNVFSFMKIVERYTNIPLDIQFEQFLKDITTIRHHFAHSYEKDISIGSYSKAFSSFQVQTGLSLESLVLTDLTTSLPIGRLWFSLPTFYFSLRDIFKGLKDNPKLLIKK